MRDAWTFGLREVKRGFAVCFGTAIAKTDSAGIPQVDFVWPRTGAQHSIHQAEEAPEFGQSNAV